MGYRLVHHREIPGGKQRVAIGEGAGQDDAQFQAVMVMFRNRPAAGDAQQTGVCRSVRRPNRQELDIGAKPSLRQFAIPQPGAAQEVGMERLRDRQIERRERWRIPGCLSHVSDIRWPS